MPTTAPDSDHPGLPVLQVAAGVIRNAQGAVLIAQRPGNGLWELPGGKFEPGETAYKALVRELHEELGITVTAAFPFMRICHRYPDKQVHLHVWQVLDYHGEPHGLDGQPLAWVLPEQLTDYPCLAANIPIVNAIRLNLPPPSLRAPFWSRIGRWIAWLLLLAGLIGLGFFIGKQQSHWRSVLEPDAVSAIHLVLPTACDPTHTICTAHAENRDLSLSVGVGEEVKPLIPFPVQVQLAGSASQTVRQVAVHFTMSGMDMRLWPMPLHPRANGGDGLWQGNAIVPLCTTGRQDWEITVVMHGQEQFVAGPFSFVVQR